MAVMAVGNYQTACEGSTHRIQIDAWLNEGKACAWISRELKTRWGEKISDNSIRKYKKYREDFLRTELEKDPEYQGKMQLLDDHLNNSIGKIKEVDVIGRLSDIIDQNADLLQEARGVVKIRNAQDLRFVQQSMLDAIKLYGDTILRAQRYAHVENDPSLLKPTIINVTTKDTLIGILADSVNNGGYEIIDRLRAGIGAESGQDGE